MALVTAKKSLRFLTHLEVNLLGSKKICSFNCGYCNLGPTIFKLKDLKDDSLFPAHEDALYELKEFLKPKDAVFDRIIVSGNGEPTLYPRFAEFARELKEFRDALRPEVKTTLLTSGAHLEIRKVLEAAQLFDELIIKVDVGTEPEFKAVANPLVRGGLERVLNASRRVKDPIVQTMALKKDGEILIQKHLDDYCESVGILSPIAVQLQTPQGPVFDASLMALTEDELETLASQLRRRLKVEVLVYFE